MIEIKYLQAESGANKFGTCNCCGKSSSENPLMISVKFSYYGHGKLDSKGIYLQEDGGYWRCLFYTGVIFMTFAYPKGQFKKTGKHYDIQSILEAMRK